MCFTTQQHIISSHSSKYKPLIHSGYVSRVADRVFLKHKRTLAKLSSKRQFL